MNLTSLLVLWILALTHYLAVQRLLITEVSLTRTLLIKVVV